MTQTKKVHTILVVLVQQLHKPHSHLRVTARTGCTRKALNGPAGGPGKKDSWDDVSPGPSTADRTAGLALETRMRRGDLLASTTFVKGRHPLRGDVIRCDQQKLLAGAGRKRGFLGGGGSGASKRSRRFVGRSKAMANLGGSNASPPVPQTQAPMTNESLVDDTTKSATSSPSKKHPYSILHAYGASTLPSPL